MNRQRLDKLLAWLSTGATAIALGGFLIVWGWLFPLLSEQPARYKSTPVDPQTAFVGGLLLSVVGLLFVTRAVVGKQRSDD